MKKSVRLLSLLMMTMIVMSMLMVTSVAATTGTVNASNVNVRASASTSSKVLTTLSKGTKVEVISQTSSGWYKIKTGSITGYVLKTYITLNSSSSSSGSSTSSSTTSSTTTTSSSSSSKGTTTKSAKMYEKASTKSTVLQTIPKGKTVTIKAKTTSFYKVTYNSKTGYVLKTSIELTSSSSSGQSAQEAVNTRPGDSLGVYTSSDITKPASTITSKLGLWNAINYNLINFNDSFTINVKNFDASWMPSKFSYLEYAYASANIEISYGTESSNITPITFKVSYNEAGRILQSLKKGTTLASSDTKALELKAIVDEVVKAVNGKTEYQKVVYIHDYIVKRAQYVKPPTTISYTAYGTLVKKEAYCQGYAESFGLLATASGLENRVVWANSLMNDGTGTHGFNKVKVSGKWYNVDCTVDDPYENVDGRVRRDFLLVTDSVSAQRYSWDKDRYPASTTKNNWHHRNKMVATTQKELETLVKAAIAKKQTEISVWVEDYTTSKYSTSFAKSVSGVKSATAYTTPSYTPSKAYATAIFFVVTYK